MQPFLLLLLLLSALAATLPATAATSAAALPAPDPPAWTAVGPPAPGVIGSVAFDPAHPAIALAAVASAGIVRSTDGGVTWQASSSGLRPSFFDNLTIHPRQSQLAYFNSELNFLGRSLDGGLTWSELPVPGSRLLAFAPAPSDPALVYAGTDLGLFVSRNQGAAWRRVGGGGLPRFYSAVAVAVDAGNPRWVYAGIRSSADFGLFASEDGGQTWVRRLRGIPTTLYCDPLRSGFVYLLESGLLQRSRDRGATWEPYFTRAPLVNDLAFDPRRPATAYIATSFSSEVVDYAPLLATADDGIHWQPVSANGPALLPGLIALSSAGTLLFSGGLPSSFLRSADGGASWQSAESGIVASYVQAAAFGSDGALLAGCAFGQSGVQRSLDGGATWTQVLATGNDVTALAASPSDRAVQYAAALPAQVPAGELPTILWKSTDNGDTWQALPYPQPAASPYRGITVFELAVDPGDSDLVYLAAQGVAFGLPGAQGIYRSLDGGRTWELAAALPPVQYNGVETAPGQPGTVWATAYQGAYKSVDRGVTWSLVLSPAAGALHGAAVAPSDPDVVWVIGDNVTYRSADGGATWRQLSGLIEAPFFALPPLGRGLAVDPADPYTAYVAWDGGVARRSPGTGWQTLDDGLLNHNGVCLAFDPADATHLVLGTGGAGMFAARVVRPD